MEQTASPAPSTAMQQHKSVKYSLLSNVEEEGGDPSASAVAAGMVDDRPGSGAVGVDDEVALGGESAGAFNFTSVWSYPADAATSDANYNSKYNYNSAFKYRDAHVRIRMDNLTNSNMVALSAEDDVSAGPRQPAYWLVVTSWMLTFFSYLFFVLTIPVSYWMLVKKMGEFDRLVVFRLGKMIGVKGEDVMEKSCLVPRYSSRATVVLLRGSEMLLLKRLVLLTMLLVLLLLLLRHLQLLLLLILVLQLLLPLLLLLLLLLLLYLCCCCCCC